MVNIEIDCHIYVQKIIVLHGIMLHEDSNSIQISLWIIFTDCILYEKVPRIFYYDMKEKIEENISSMVRIQAEYFNKRNTRAIHF